MDVIIQQFMVNDVLKKFKETLRIFGRSLIADVNLLDLIHP
jgi:hypothetical protein